MDPKLIKKAYSKRRKKILWEKLISPVRKKLEEAKEGEFVPDGRMEESGFVKIIKFDFPDVDWRGVCVVGGKTMRNGKVVDE